MKKIYSNPIAKIVILDDNDLIATSPYGRQTMSFGGEEEEGVADAHSRNNPIWDD